MTTTGQDFTTYAGDAALPIFTVTDAAGAAIDISTVQNILWSAQRNLSAIAVLSKTKSASQIAFVTDGKDGKFQVTISGSDTNALTGYYVHQAQIIDSLGNTTTVATGRMRVGRAPIWTYTGDPANSDRDALRYLIQDTDESDQQVYDSELDYVLTKYTTPIAAAAFVCLQLAQKYARLVDKSVGDLRISYSQRKTNYLDLADRYKTEAGVDGVQVYAGGISVADMQSVNNNTDRNKPPFSIGMDDRYPPPGEQSSSQDDGSGWSDWP